MLQRLTTETINKLLIIAVILLVVELSFSNGGLIVTLIFSSLLTYLGWKRYQKLWAKILFWSGLILLLITVLNMVAFRFLFIAAIILFLIHYTRSQKTPEKIIPYFDNYHKGTLEEINEPLLKVEPLLQQRIFGDLKTSDEAYRWSDINIHGGVGNRIIDLSNTVLPDESIISIRHFVGNMTIYVPYEVEVCIVHSSLMGRANVFGNYHERLMNQSIIYQTEGYNIKKPRVKILTSIWSGDIEVKRI
ncbi:cell wall-active antibiotics response protein LiaF [Bacillus sp. AK128]